MARPDFTRVPRVILLGVFATAASLSAADTFEWDGWVYETHNASHFDSRAAWIISPAGGVISRSNWGTTGFDPETPGPQDDVYFPEFVVAGGNRQSGVRNLVADNGLIVSQTITLNGDRIENNGQIVLGAEQGGRLYLADQPKRLTGSGSLVLDRGHSTAIYGPGGLVIEPGSLVGGNGEVATPIVNQANIVAADGRLTFRYYDIDNTGGTVKIASNGHLSLNSLNGVSTNLFGGTIVGEAGSSFYSSGVIRDTTFEGTHSVNGNAYLGGVINNTGMLGFRTSSINTTRYNFLDSLELRGGGRLLLGDDGFSGDQVAGFRNGRLSDGVLRNTDGHAIQGFGSIFATLENHAVIQPSNHLPGSRVGELYVDHLTNAGAASPDGAGVLLFDLGGSGIKGVDYDHIEARTVQLGGDLELAYVDGFRAQLGDTFELIRARDITGSFDNWYTPELDPGLSWRLRWRQLSSREILELSVVQQQAGDANNDGVVSAADYAVLRDSLGRFPQSALGDFAKNFGDDSRQPLSAAVVPEPTACWLACCLAGVLAARQRRVA